MAGAFLEFPEPAAVHGKGRPVVKGEIIQKAFQA